MRFETAVDDGGDDGRAEGAADCSSGESETCCGGKVGMWCCELDAGDEEGEGA